jgi:hypothetical protein
MRIRLGKTHRAACFLKFDNENCLQLLPKPNFQIFRIKTLRPIRVARQLGFTPGARNAPLNVIQPTKLIFRGAFE